MNDGGEMGAFQLLGNSMFVELPLAPRAHEMSGIESDLIQAEVKLSHISINHVQPGFHVLGISSIS